jgi:hypothetical protein
MLKIIHSLYFPDKLSDNLNDQLYNTVYTEARIYNSTSLFLIRENLMSRN